MATRGDLADGRQDDERVVRVGGGMARRAAVISSGEMASASPASASWASAALGAAFAAICSLFVPLPLPETFTVLVGPRTSIEQHDAGTRGELLGKLDVTARELELEPCGT